MQLSKTMPHGTELQIQAQREADTGNQKYRERMEKGVLCPSAAKSETCCHFIQVV